MKYVGCKVKVGVTSEDYPCKDLKATFACATNIPQTATFDPSTRSFTYSDYEPFSVNFTGITSDELFFFPVLNGADLKLTLTAGTAYKLPVAGRNVKFSGATSFKSNGSYTLNFTLKYNYLYLYSDGTTGQYTDAAHATKTPIAMVVSQSKRLAISIKDDITSFYGER